MCKQSRAAGLLPSGSAAQVQHAAGKFLATAMQFCMPSPFLSMMLLRFLMRTVPASSIAKPDCMKKTWNEHSSTPAGQRPEDAHATSHGANVGNDVTKRGVTRGEGVRHRGAR